MSAAKLQKWKSVQNALQNPQLATIKEWLKLKILRLGTKAFVLKLLNAGFIVRLPKNHSLNQFKESQKDKNPLLDLKLIFFGVLLTLAI